MSNATKDWRLKRRRRSFDDPKALMLRQGAERLTISVVASCYRSMCGRTNLEGVWESQGRHTTRPSQINKVCSADCKSELLEWRKVPFQCTDPYSVQVGRKERPKQNVPIAKERTEGGKKRGLRVTT